MRRREFITLLGSAATWPLAARAQQAGRIRQIAGLIPYAESDPQSRSRVSALHGGLEKRGWKIGQNLRIEYRWEINNNERAQAATADLLRLTPEVLIASSLPAIRAVQQATHTIPVVFTAVSEPVELGFVASLSHPGGNIIGFTNLEETVGTKWLELLKEIAPHVTHVAFMYNPDTSGSAARFVRMAEAVAPKFAVATSVALVHTPSEIQSTMTTLGREPGAGLIIPLDGFLGTYYKLVTELAARHQLPAMYPLRQFPSAGGLISYGPDVPDQFRRAASYVDRILRGEKPADLPVQNPTKYELVINLKTVKALGLEVPPMLLAIADEVIE